MDVTNTVLGRGGEGGPLIVDRGLVRDARKVHGQNPAALVPKILRERVLDSLYWKLTAQGLDLYGLIDECVENVCLVGTYADSTRTRPTHFVCLLFRLIHIGPSLDIVEWLMGGAYKYLRALAAVYYRIMCEDNARVWLQLEHRLLDTARIRIVEPGSNVTIVHMDHFVDGLLREGRFCEMALPRLVSRVVLEESGMLEPRESPLLDEFDALLDAEES